MPTLLVISGLDPSGGAGFLADVRVAALLGVRAVGVVTATTVQDTRGVRAVEPTAAAVLGEALEALLGDVEVDAVKIGMLGTARIAEIVARALAATRAPVVWDPVMMPSRGGVPLVDDPRAALQALVPEARLMTPNLDEATALTGLAVVDEDSMRVAARAIPAAAVLVKGGHLVGAPRDILRDGDSFHVFDGVRLDPGPLHGTGCVLSSAIACGLANGVPLIEAVRAAKQLVTERIARPLVVGRGARCLL